MEIGQQVITFQGETKRIESKLPRPGPRTVYNLEVYGEHVYFVGNQGLLAHNAYADDAPTRAANVVDDVGTMRTRLSRLGYDEANIARIMNAIENGEQVVIVGENMRRVGAVSRMVEKAGGRSVTYAPRNWSGLNRNSLEANRSWIRYWAKDNGATVIDIGRQPTIRPDGPSPFYGLENRSLNRWGIYTPFGQ